MTRRAFVAGLSCAGGGYGADPDVHAQEREIFARINLLRARAGSAALGWDEALSAAARRESADMARLGFFSHLNPERGDLAARLREAGIRWWLCAENILKENRFDDPVSVAEVEWWYSPGHRENLVNPVYTRTGGGLARAGDGTEYATQIFLRPLPPGMRRR